MLEINKVYQGNFLEIINKIDKNKIDLIITDPPYPDYYTKEYQYDEKPIKYLDKFKCRQLIFWTAKDLFILDYTAIHIWDKRAGGLGSFYERIFERNGNANYKVYNFISINNSVRANFAQDILYGHPSQKPIKLMEKLVSEYSKEGDLILDPFCGSGSTLLACKKLKRNYIGIEIEPKYCEIARQRLRQGILL